MTRPVLVLDGSQKSALAIVRSLGRRGIPVWCGAQRGTAIGCRSRYTKAHFTYPEPKADQTKFLEAIRSIAVAVGDRPIVYTCSDATTTTLFDYRNELNEFLGLVFPDADSFHLATDKGATYSEARVLGVPAVRTFIRERVEEVHQLAQELTFPVVVKPRHSVLFKNEKGVGGTAIFAHTETELINQFKTLFELTGEAPLIQPFMKGEEYGVELLGNNGIVVAETIHHRIRSMSPVGGASVVKETLEESELTRKLRQHAYTLIEALKWSGPLMVEFKLDEDTHEPKLMELNGRWWGSLPLAIAAGVDFPYLFYQMAQGMEMPCDVITAEPYNITRHFLGDTRHLLRVLFARDPMRPHVYPSRRKALHDFFRMQRGTKSDIWSLRDPFPFFVEYVDVIAKLFK